MSMLLQDAITRDFWQGVLKLYILEQASQSPIYGGRLKKQLQGIGYQISPGTLYPILHELERAGLFKSQIKVFKGRARKYYYLTEQGRLFLAEVKIKVAGVLKFLTLPPGETTNAATNKPAEIIRGSLHKS